MAITRTSTARAAGAVVLRCQGRTVGRYTYRPATVPEGLSPRPYLHPLTTLKGTPVTESMPQDHAHHLGVSVVVPDVVQAHQGWLLRDPDGFVEELSWRAAGRELLRERRTVAVRPFGEDCWALDFTFALTNPSGRELSLAGYGGFFWRAPAEPARARVFTADAEGEDEAHGRTADWLALGGRDWTLVFAGVTEATRADPWSVRTAEYPGVGSSPAWADRLRIGPGETRTRRIATAVVDGRLDRVQAAALVHRLTEGGV